MVLFIIFRNFKVSKYLYIFSFKEIYKGKKRNSTKDENLDIYMTIFNFNILMKYISEVQLYFGIKQVLIF